MKNPASLLSGLFAPVTTRLILMALLALFMASGSHAAQVTELDSHFQNPPEETQPWCYWFWLNGDISKEGITKDLEAMAEVGIQRTLLFNVFGGGPVKMFSQEWYDLTHYAFKEASRLSIEVMPHNAPGWSQSGGPWITPEQSMRRVTWNEFPAQGGAFSRKVRPDNIPAGQDIAVLAVPRPEAVSIVGSKSDQADRTLRFVHSEPLTARALVVHGKAKGRLYALQNGQRKFIAKIDANGGHKRTDFLPNAIETFSFNEVTAKEFELVSNAKCKVVLTSEPTVAQVIEKQLGRMHPTPHLSWEAYIFPDTVEPEDPATVIKQDAILDLTDQLNAAGELNCTLPPGHWDVIYFGMITTGKTNRPAPPEATGLECDKMSKKHIRTHFEAMFGKLLKEMTPEERSALKGITIDSYEVGAQNWTDGFAADFANRNGYSPITLLPVMTGRVIDSAKKSDQFLWDLRRTVADMIAEYYVGGIRDVAHEHDLTLWCENYGHWGFASDFLIYGGYSDMVGGEFWVGDMAGGSLGNIECRAASSSGHIYGKRRIYAEAFTSRLNLGDHPYTFKARGDEMFCEGINHFVLTVYSHQPTDGVPGKNPWFGTAFHRNTPWFNESRNWVSYLQRCHLMLQQGNPLADVAVYIGDFAPQMIGPANPVPAGYDYDYVGSDAILRTLDVVDGKWVVYDEHDSTRIAVSYPLLAMPKVKYIRPKVLKRLDELKAKGGRVVDGVPVTAQVLQSAGIAPVVSDATCTLRWKARQLDDGMIFFLSNFEKTGAFEATLRVTGKAPEWFNPVTGQTRKLARYKSVDNGTRIMIDIKDRSDACFIVFRDKPSQPSVLDVTRAGKPVLSGELDIFYDPDYRLTAESAQAGNYTLHMSDGTQRELTIEQDAQSFVIEGPWQSRKQDEKGYSVLKETRFDLPANFGQGKRVLLDLGQVEVMAKVTLNGTSYDTLWMPPFTLDVTDAVKSGGNTLSVRVTSTSKGQPKLGETVQLRTLTRKPISQSQ